MSITHADFGRSTDEGWAEALKTPAYLALQIVKGTREVAYHARRYGMQVEGEEALLAKAEEKMAFIADRVGDL